MKRRGFIALFLIICLSLVFVSCDADSGNGNGKIVSLNFEAPGVLAYRENKRAALVGYTYTVNNYKVYANYSNGYREDVTQVAKITSNDEYVTVGNGNTLTFTNIKEDKSASKDGNEYSLTVEYAGITLPVTAWAYAAGEPIDGLKNPRSTFYEGELLSSFAGASMLDKDGNYFYATILPDDGYVLFLNESDDMYFVSLSDKYTFKGDESLMYYVSIASDGSSLSSVTMIPHFEVVKYKDSDIKSLNLGLFAKYPKIGDNIDSFKFVETYFKGQKGSITLKNGANFKVQMVDGDGTQNEGYSFSFTVKNSKGEEKTSGEFAKGDTFTVTVEYKGVKGVRSYTISNRD